MLMYSFGGLSRSGTDDGDLLPPGIGERDLLGISVGPDLDSTTVQACLKELKEQCLYLHFDGVRYCFKKDPNVTLLVEQEADAVARNDSRVRGRIKAMVEERLAGHRSAIVWPAKSGDVPDKDAQFLIAYLPIEFAALPAAERQQKAMEFCENFGNRTREFRNGLGLAVPSVDQIEILRRAVRYLLAVESVRAKWREHNLTDAQKSQLKERDATERAAAESALLKLYGQILLPASDDGSLSLDTVSMGGRPLQTTLDEKKRAKIQQRLLELLTTVHRKVFGTVRAGEDRRVVSGSEQTSPASGASRPTRSWPGSFRSSDSRGFTRKTSCARRSRGAWKPVSSRTRPDDRALGNQDTTRSTGPASPSTEASRMTKSISTPAFSSRRPPFQRNRRQRQARRTLSRPKTTALSPRPEEPPNSAKRQTSPTSGTPAL